MSATPPLTTHPSFEKASIPLKMYLKSHAILEKASEKVFKNN
jgi:hypothetical protein